MSKLTRLPVQHPRAPHCPACKAALPNLNSVMVTVALEDDFEVVSMTFRIRCKCGLEWDLTKQAKDRRPAT